MATLFLVRHAEGFHNIYAPNVQIQDPQLTPRGRDQCATLKAAFPHHERITHLIASPLRRTLYTCLLSFATPAPAADDSSSPVNITPPTIIAIPELQETSAEPCDTGSNPAILAAEFSEGPWAGRIDLSRVERGWNEKLSPSSPWGCSAPKLEERARIARIALRQIAKDFTEHTGRQAVLVVVTHGGLLHYLTGDWAGHDSHMGTGWANTEVREFEFVAGIGSQDERALVSETAESLKSRDRKPLTEDEQRELKAAAASRDVAKMEEKEKAEKEKAEKEKAEKEKEKL